MQPMTTDTSQNVRPQKIVFVTSRNAHCSALSMAQEVHSPTLTTILNRVFYLLAYFTVRYSSVINIPVLVFLFLYACHNLYVDTHPI